ncbi:uncharacterized protein KIAA1755 homolog, partial [Nannospalax galili]|uniref:uncharacterized protein KIAA1755 homolog n=1 Tax=Nannospalax galili TaxID=1026970 RepID=UPI0004ED291C
APYAHCLFLHEGWPLCLRDEVVVHLAPLSPLLLRQGDFYLQVEPRKEQSVCMTLKCLSSDLRKVDKKSIPESSYSVLFTPEWLEAINSNFKGCPLHNCLVASENGIITVPWTRIINPEFVDDRPPAVNVPLAAEESCPLEAPHLSSPQEPYQASSPDSMGSVSWSWDKGKGRVSGDKYPGLIKVEPGRPGERAFRMDREASQDLEGDYVALLGFSQECRGVSASREMVTLREGTVESSEDRSGTKGMALPGRVLPLPGSPGGPPLTRRTCTKPAGSGEGLCTGGLRRKARHKARVYMAEQQPQQSHLDDPEILDCASGQVADIEEESAASKMQGPLGMPEAMVQQRTGPRQASSPRLSPAAPAASASQTKTEETIPGHGRASKSTACLSRNTSSRGSPIPGLQFPFFKGQRPSPEKALPQHAGPWKALCSLDFPQSCKTQAPGKDGTTHPRTFGPTADSGPLSGEQAGFGKASAGPPGRGLSLEERSGPKPKIGVLGAELLCSGIACLPGGRDRVGRPLLLVSTGEEAWEAPWCTASAITELLSYLCSVPR